MAKMTRQEIGMIGFEIVAYSGDARSKLLEALKFAKKGELDKVDPLIEEAKKNLLDAHKAQTEMITLEAQGEELDLGLIMVHAQDHLMTTLLLKDLIYNLIDIYKK